MTSSGLFSTVCFDFANNNNSPLFSTEGGAKTADEFAADIAISRAKIDCYFRENKHLGDHVILFHSDSYQFVVRLFALALAGKNVVLPANGQKETLESLLVEYQAYIGEELISPQNNIDCYSIEEDFKPVCCPLMWPDAGELIFFTSGSTGDAKRIIKSWQQINLELSQLQCQFNLDPESKVFAGVSHQHIYGLLFRVLWPIQQGCFVDFNTYKYPEHLAAKIAGKQHVVLISSPAQLSRLVDDNVIAGVNCQMDLIVSSGGPLRDQDAVSLFKQFGVAVTQVYGSTETGGIATRQVTHTVVEPWRTFDGITVDIDRATQCLLLTSPYLNNQAVLLDDRIRLTNDGGFILLGRSDRTIKLEEKRLDLDAMESVLLTNALVKEARVQAITTSRMTLCAAIVLNTEGVEALANLGKRALNEHLKKHLLKHFERVCLPRKWRYIEALPYNLQGKLLHKDLENLFE